MAFFGFFISVIITLDYVDKILEAGFMGSYLDKVDEFE